MTFVLGLSRLDPAIVYSVLVKGWAALAGLVGILLIGRFFTPDMQGFYYTFASLIALQSFVELGLYLVIAATASHEWAKLRLSKEGKIEGDAHALSRLVSLGRFIFKWYAVAVVLFMLLAGVGGYWFLGQSTAAVDWQGPWVLHVFFSSLLLWCMPFLSLLEGCDQVAQVARFRFWQGVFSNVVFWIAIAAGAGLWAAPALSLVATLACLYFLIVVRRNFFRSFLLPPTVASMDWRTEIFPMQWRLAIQGVVGYFVYASFTPVLFYFHGPAVAGQMGMSQQIVMAVLSVSLVWATTKAPRFGVLVAQRERRSLDLEWKSATARVVTLMAFGAAAMSGAAFLLNAINWGSIHRIVPPWPFSMLAAGAVFAAAVQCIAIYLRAHKTELLTANGLISGLLMAALVWALGAAYGPLGVAGSYLAVMAGVTFPMALLVWRRFRLTRA